MLESFVTNTVAENTKIRRKALANNQALVPDSTAGELSMLGIVTCPDFEFLSPWCFNACRLPQSRSKVPAASDRR